MSEASQVGYMFAQAQTSPATAGGSHLSPRHFHFRSAKQTCQGSSQISIPSDLTLALFARSSSRCATVPFREFTIRYPWSDTDEDFAYSQRFCGGNSITVMAPGIPNLATAGWGYGRIKSYICWAPGATSAGVTGGRPQEA